MPCTLALEQVPGEPVKVNVAGTADPVTTILKVQTVVPKVTVKSVFVANTGLPVPFSLIVCMPVEEMTPESWKEKPLRRSVVIL